MGTPAAWLSFLWYFCVHMQLEMGIVGRSALHGHFFDHLFCYHRPAAVSCSLALRAGSLAHGGGAPVRHGLKSASPRAPSCPRRPLALFPLRARVIWRGARLHLRRGAPVRAGAGHDVLLPRRRARAHRFLRLPCLYSALTRSLCGCYARRRRRCGRHSCRGSRRARSCRCSCGRGSFNCPCGGTHCRAAKQGQVRAGLEAAPRCCCCCFCSFSCCCTCCCSSSCSCCCPIARPSVIASTAALTKTRAFSCRTIPGSRCWISCSKPRCGAFFLARGSGASQKEAVGPTFWWPRSGISGARPAPRLSSTARAAACGRCTVIPRSLRRAATRVRRSIHATEPAAPSRPLLSARKPAQRRGRGAFQRRCPRAHSYAACGGAAL